ncbi:2-dehydro-3-deoxygluconokinase [Gemmatimonadetes bacterium T265]|nr:2-dehydro-3-deoxygluconokinase [Gemmatimonadetes bacterium T265]
MSAPAAPQVGPPDVGAPHVVTFGEVLLRLSPPHPHERLFQSPTLRTWFGGSEANVAAGLARLGTAVEHVTRVPAHAVGDAALAALRAEGVGVRHVARGGTRLGAYFVESGADLRPLHTVYDRAGSAFAELEPAHLDWDAALRGVEWFHVSGIVPALGDGPRRTLGAALDAARARGIPVSVDLNWRPALWNGRDPRPTIERLAASAHLLIANPGAVDIMLGEPTAGTAPEPPDALRDTAARLCARFGCADVALTQRDVRSAHAHAWTAHLYEGATGTLHSAPRYEMHVVDRVGGGDSFVAALLHARLAGRPPADAVRFAAAAGALKLTIPGDFNRVSAEEVDRLLAAAAPGS